MRSDAGVLDRRVSHRSAVLASAGAPASPPVRPGTDGKFRVTNLLPSEYFLAALTDFDPNDWSTPSFLEQVATAGAIRITVGEGEKKVQDLRVAGGGDR